MKDKLVKENSKYETVELWRLQGMFDLMNSVFVAVQNYHTKYGFDDKEVVNEEIKPQISSNNKEWHKINKLKTFASLDEKVKWHIDHVANCKC